MSLYRVREPPPVMLRRRNRNGLRLAGYVLFAAVAFTQSGPPWLTDLGRIALFLAVFSVYSLWSILRQLRSRDRLLVEVLPDAVRSVDARGRDRRLPRDQIVGMRDVLHGGFVLRSRDPRCSLLIPADLDGLDACRDEILAMHVAHEPLAALAARAWALGVMMTAIASVAIASTVVIRVIGAIVFAVSAIYLAVRRDKNPGAACAVPDPATRARSLARMREWSLGLSLAGMVVAIAQAWWTKSTDGLGAGLVMVFLGGTGLMIFVAGERLVIATAWFAALAALGAVVGAGVLWIAPASDLGGDLMMFVALVAALGEIAVLLTKLFNRLPSLTRWGDVLTASGLFAAFAVRQLRHHSASTDLIAAAILVAFTLMMHRVDWRERVLAVAVPLRLCVIALGLIAMVVGNKEMSFWAWTVFVLLPDWWPRPAPQSASAA